MNYKNLLPIIAEAEDKIKRAEATTFYHQDQRGAIITENKNFIALLQKTIDQDFDYWFDQLIEVSAIGHPQIWNKATHDASRNLEIQMRQQWEKSDLSALITRVKELKTKYKKP